MSSEQHLARRCAWFAITAQVVFVCAWVLSGALQSRYSHLDQGVSELASTFAEHPWIVRSALLLLGLSLLALAAALRRTLPRTGGASAATGLFGLAGIGLAATAFLPLDCSFGLDETCGDRFQNGDLAWASEAHIWLSLVIRLAVVATPFALWLALRSHPVGPLTLTAGIFGVAFGVVAFLAGSGESVADGLLNRAELGLLQVWAALVAVGILHATAHIEAPDQRTPLSPKDFFGRRWEGRGEIVMRPAFFWRFFPQRFDFTRDTEWVGDGIWLVVDRSRFERGWATERRMVCELQGTDRLRVTAGDMPEGAWYELGEDGYRIRPYVLMAPLGPISVPLRCRDQHRVAPDGTLIDVVDMHFLGVRVARLEGRARPIEDREGPINGSPLHASPA